MSFRRCIIAILAISLMALLLSLKVRAQNPRHPFPQHLNYGKGTIMPNNYSREEMDQHVEAFYDYWKSQYLVDAGTDQEGHQLYRIALGRIGTENHDVTVSEGQGYGMIIVAIMAGYDPQAQEIFDGLWRYSRSHPSDIDPRLMAWRVPPDPTGNDSAFDGDADMAFALLLAHAQWGSNGDINYLEEARTLITAIMESTIGPKSKLPMLGDWVDPNGEDYNQYTNRLSDFMTANFRAFYKATKKKKWKKVIGSCLKTIKNLQKRYAPYTGLVPDFIEPFNTWNHQPQPAHPYFLESEFDGEYYYNSCRVPLRLGMDALLYKNRRAKRLVRKISKWARKTTRGNPLKFHAGYYLSGAPLPDSDYFSTAFVAPLGVAAMTNPKEQKWLNRIYDAVKEEHQDYYEDSLTLLSLLLMTGNFWAP